MQPVKPAGLKPERQETLRRFFALPLKEQLAAFKEMGDYLAEQHGVEPEVDRAASAKQDAIVTLTRAQDHLLKTGAVIAGEPLTKAAYESAARELGLKLSGSSIVRVFGTWRNAAKAVAGGAVPESAAQRRHRLRVAGRQRSHEDYLAALRVWLETDPDDLRRRNYDAFAESRNSKRQLQARALPRAAAVASGLGIPWRECLAVARGERTLQGARESALGRSLSGLSKTDLVGVSVVAARVGVRVQGVDELVEAGRLSQPVASIANHKAWLLGDVERCRADEKPKQRKRLERQDHFYDSVQLAEVLDRDPPYMRTLIHKKKWHLVPPPRGRVGPVYYWRRTDVKAWLDGRRRG